jgi:uncharacterized protein YbcV (DUF1398 family)
MNENVVKEVITQTLSGTIAFPEVVRLLSNEGFDSYHVDFLRGEGRYYHHTGESLQEKFDHEFPPIAENFSAEGVQAAIRRILAGSSRYPDFIRECASAGCAYYIVYLTGKKVRYLGRNGGEHVEYFPGQGD